MPSRPRVEIAATTANQARPLEPEHGARPPRSEEVRAEDAGKRTRGGKCREAHQHRPDVRPSRVEERRRPPWGDDGESDRQRKHDHRDHRAGCTSACARVCAIEVRKRCRDDVAHLIADGGRRRIGKVVRVVVRAHHAGSEVPADQQVVPPAHAERRDRRER